MAEATAGAKLPNQHPESNNPPNWHNSPWATANVVPGRAAVDRWSR